MTLDAGMLFNTFCNLQIKRQIIELLKSVRFTRFSMTEDNWKTYKSFKVNSRLTAAYYELVCSAFEAGVGQVIGGNGVSAAIDLGCGSGELTRRLRRYAAHVTGVDASPGLIKQARGDADQTALDFILADVLDESVMDGLPPKHFDLATAAWLHNHMATAEAQRQLLQTVLRLLKPGGCIVFLIPGDAFTTARSQRFAARLDWHQAWLDETPEYNLGIYKFGDSGWTEMTVWQPMWLARLYSPHFQIRFLDVKGFSIGHPGLGDPPTEPLFDVMMGTPR